jgi:hypothetical protein
MIFNGSAIDESVTMLFIIINNKEKFKSRSTIKSTKRHIKIGQLEATMKAKGKFLTIPFLLLLSLFLVPGDAIQAGDGPGISSEAALNKLKTGNERYYTGKREYPNLDQDRRKATTKGQNPFATVIACSD